MKIGNADNLATVALVGTHQAHVAFAGRLQTAAAKYQPLDAYIGKVVGAPDAKVRYGDVGQDFQSLAALDFSDSSATSQRFHSFLTARLAAAKPTTMQKAGLWLSRDKNIDVLGFNADINERSLGGVARAFIAAEPAQLPDPYGAMLKSAIADKLAGTVSAAQLVALLETYDYMLQTPNPTTIGSLAWEAAVKASLNLMSASGAWSSAQSRAGGALAAFDALIGQSRTAMPDRELELDVERPVAEGEITVRTAEDMARISLIRDEPRQRRALTNVVRRAIASDDISLVDTIKWGADLASKRDENFVGVLRSAIRDVTGESMGTRVYAQLLETFEQHVDGELVVVLLGQYAAHPTGEPLRDELLSLFNRINLQDLHDDGYADRFVHSAYGALRTLEERQRAADPSQPLGDFTDFLRHGDCVADLGQAPDDFSEQVKGAPRQRDVVRYRASVDYTDSTSSPELHPFVRYQAPILGYIEGMPGTDYKSLASAAFFTVSGTDKNGNHLQRLITNGPALDAILSRAQRSDKEAVREMLRGLETKIDSSNYKRYDVFKRNLLDKIRAS